MKKLLIFGDGDLAELACFYFRQSGRDVVGFCVDGAYLTRESVLGLPVYAFEDVGEKFPASGYDLFVAIGSSKVNKVRRDMYLRMKTLGYGLATCISKHAVVHTEAVGDNCLILDMNNIHPFTRIGNNVIFSNSNHIGHHSTVGDHCFITGNVVVCGRAEVGEGTFMGVHTTVRERVKIGRYNVIGMGVSIHKDTADDMVFSREHVKPRDVRSSDLTDI